MAISNSRPNSNARNLEGNSAMRRSFSGNPSQRLSIHANPRSPAEFSRINSLRKEEKENKNKDHHETLKELAMVRSPSVSKSSSRFMMPTISAASKTNPSPRKKVLADKNEPLLRTSLSFSDLKSLPDSTNNFSQKIDLKDTEISEDTTFETPSIANRLRRCHSHTSPESSDIEPIIGSNTKLFASSISPLDADPAPPPYDPKTNYLSPRPQFLHYRPKPRLELYYQKEQSTGKNNIEDSFLSESSSDSEVSEESEPEEYEKESESDFLVEAVNGMSEKEFDNASSVEGFDGSSGKESEEGSSSSVEGINDENSEKVAENVDSSVEVVINKKSEEEEEEQEKDYKVQAIIQKFTKSEEEHEKDYYSVQAIIKKFEKESKGVSAIEVVSEEVEPEVIEAEPIANPPGTLFSNESSEEEKVISKSRFLTIGKLIPLFFILFSIVCLSLSYTTYSPFTNLPAIENLKSSKFYEENLKPWSDYSKSYVNEVIGSFRRGDNKFDLLQFSNVTTSIQKEDPFAEVKRFKENYEQDEVEPVFNEYEDEFEHQLDQSLENGIDHNKRGSDWEEKLCTEEAAAEVIKGDDDHTVSDLEIEFSTSTYSSGDIIVKAVSHQGDHIVYNSEIESNTTEVGNLEKGYNNVSDFEMESTLVSIPSSGSGRPSEYNSETSELVEIKENDPIISDSEIEPEFGNTFEMDASNSLAQYETVAISLVAVVLMAAPVLTYLKIQKPNSSISTARTDKKSTTKSMKLVPIQKTYLKDVDFVEESCPSEMSSSESRNSYSSRKVGMSETAKEAQSQERSRRQKRAIKRDSLASSLEFSTSDSPSYGSFTTYERLPIKHGYGDDEVVTPVRRSSRIKKIQVISS